MFMLLLKHRHCPIGLKVILHQLKPMDSINQKVVHIDHWYNHFCEDDPLAFSREQYQANMYDNNYSIRHIFAINFDWINGFEYVFDDHAIIYQQLIKSPCFWILTMFQKHLSIAPFNQLISIGPTIPNYTWVPNHLSHWPVTVKAGRDQDQS